MSIWIVKKGTITCDECKTEIAEITMSRQVLDVLEDEAKTITIKCAVCVVDKPSSV